MLNKNINRTLMTQIRQIIADKIICGNHNNQRHLCSILINIADSHFDL